MTRLFEDEMTLKTTLLMGDPTVTSNALVSCVTSLKEKLHPLIFQLVLVCAFSPKSTYVVMLIFC
jgi:hypothetical protein